MDAQTNDSKMENAIMQELFQHTGHEAILVPTMFKPPIMLSNIFRIACQLKKRGMTTGPDRRMGGWHMRLLEPGIAACQPGGAATLPPGSRLNAR